MDRDEIDARYPENLTVTRDWAQVALRSNLQAAVPGQAQLLAATGAAIAALEERLLVLEGLYASLEGLFTAEQRLADLESKVAALRDRGVG